MKKIYNMNNYLINIIYFRIKRNFIFFTKFLMLKKNILFNFLNLIFIMMKKYFFSLNKDDKKIILRNRLIFLNIKLFYLSKKNFYKV